jgi:serine/threonine protein kinase
MMPSKLGLIGQGSYGMVYKGQNKHSKEVVAVKRLKISTSQGGVPATAIREIALLKELNHRNIIRLNDVLHSQNCVTMILEFCDWDLDRYIKSERERLSRSEIISFIHQLLLALDYVHANHIIHRDVKPQNVLVNRRKELKLGDFGLARSTSIPVGSLSTEVITIWYRPPEILFGMRDYSFPIDIWSAGCVLAEMINSCPLFPCNSNDAMLIAISQVFGAEALFAAFPQFSNSPIFSDDLRNAAPLGLRSLFRDCDEDLIELAERLLDVNPNTRITASQALLLPIFQQQAAIAQSSPLGTGQSSVNFGQC